MSSFLFPDEDSDVESLRDNTNTVYTQLTAFPSFFFLLFTIMLLYQTYQLLLQTNNGLRQAPFSFARSYLHNGEIVARLQNQLWFISVCLRRGVLPLTVKNMHLPSCIGEASQRGLRIQVLKKMKRGLRASLETAKRKLQQLNTQLLSFPDPDQEALRRGRTGAFNNAYAHTSAHLRHKLRRLCEQGGRGGSDRRGPSRASDRFVTDYTHTLNEVERSLLSKGPKFALAPAVNERTKEACKTAYARFAYQYRWSVARGSGSEHTEAGLPTFPRSSEIHLPPTNPDTEDKLRRIYHSLITTVESLPTRRKWSNLPQEEVRALQSLKSRSIALMPSDKGGEFCAIDLQTYKDLGESHLADATTYQRVPRMTAKTIETKVNRAWKSVCRQRGVHLRIARSFVFVANNTSLPTFHHLLKTHKPGPEKKIRPIVASRGGPTEKIAWLLKTVLRPLLNQVPAHIPDSDSLMEAVLNVDPSTRQQHQHQCSLDVEALYTSVPVGDALAAVGAKLRNARIPAPLQEADVILLLKTVFSLTYFHYEGCVYHQIAGLPMGSAISGLVAIIFMETVETQALQQFVHCPLYLRYVDDCYALVHDSNAARDLQACFNRQHPSIRLQLEDCQRDGDATSLSLLDLTVRIGAEGDASFNFYEKDARSGIFLHRDSALPWHQKAATIRNERHRIAVRSGENRLRNEATLEDKLRHNGYSNEDLRRIDPSRRRPPNRTPPGQIFYLDLPFLGEATEHRIRKAFAREGVYIRVYHRSTSLLDVVRPRQREILRCARASCPTADTSTCFLRNVVYRITCTPCGRYYIGSTTRHLHDRIREHTETGRGSTVHDHLTACGGGAARIQVQVLAREKDEVNTRLREAILIKSRRPELNVQTESDFVGFVF